MYLDLEEFNFEWRVLDDGMIQLWLGNNYMTLSEIEELSDWLNNKLKEINKMATKKKKKTIVAKPKTKQLNSYDVNGGLYAFRIYNRHCR